MQGHESTLFHSYFSAKGVMYLSGGVASGFKHVEAGSGVDRDMGAHNEVVLLQVKGKGANLMLTQVSTSRSAMNSGDVFVLVAPDGIYQWNGPTAASFSRHSQHHTSSPSPSPSRRA